MHIARRFQNGGLGPHFFAEIERFIAANTMRWPVGLVEKHFDPGALACSDELASYLIWQRDFKDLNDLQLCWLVACRDGIESSLAHSNWVLKSSFVV